MFTQMYLQGGDDTTGKDGDHAAQKKRAAQYQHWYDEPLRPWARAWFDAHCVDPTDAFWMVQDIGIGDVFFIAPLVGCQCRIEQATRDVVVELSSGAAGLAASIAAVHALSHYCTDEDENALYKRTYLDLWDLAREHPEGEKVLWVLNMLPHFTRGMNDIGGRLRHCTEPSTSCPT